MPRKATIKYRSLRSNLVHVPLSLYAQLAQSQTRPQGIILHLSPLVSTSSSVRTREAYVGWSGLAAASSLGLSQVGDGKEALETLEIDPEVAGSLGLSEGTIVEISIIHNPTKARSITVTPLTSDDWEILEQNASFLEENLLSQLRAAKKGQEIDVWVKGRTKIRIRVDDTHPGTNTAVLLNVDTEVYVAPRPRGSKAKSESTPQPSVIGGKGKEQAPAKTAAVMARLVPGRIASSWGPLPDVKVAGRALLCSEDVLERAKRKLGIKTDDMRVKVRLDKDVEKVEAASTEDASDAKDNEEGDKAEGLECVLVPWEEMPEGCVILTGKIDSAWEGWGRVRLYPAVAKSRKAKNVKDPLSAIELPVAELPIRLAGMEKILDQALAYLRRTCVSDAPRPLLLTGAKGSGKTSLTRLIGESLEGDRDVLSEVIYVDVGRVDGDGRITKIKETMSSWHEDLQKRGPALLILDGLDTLLPPENELTPSANTAALAHHFCSLFDSKAITSGTMVIATGVSAQGLHPMLNQRHVFGETIKVPPLNKETRREILQHLVSEQNMSARLQAETESKAELDYVTLGSMTEGYTASDLKDLVGGALQQAIIRSAQADERVSLIMEDFTSAQQAFTPISLRGVALQKSDTKWSDIGGLVEPRRVLRETLEWPTKYAQIFANCPLRLRSGLLLYGYPGCGKTLLASAVAKECGLNFISVKGPEILNKYIGASEKSVRDLFERASAAKPCVLFFDEFDSIAPKRGHDSTGVTDRVVNQLLTEMDGAQGLDGVYVLAATSRPDLIDSALLRPGRLDKSLLCDMPNKDDRLDIIRAVSTKLTVDPSIDFELIANESEGLSGADLQAVVYNAHLDVVQASIAGEIDTGSDMANGKGKGKGKAVDMNGSSKGKAIANDSAGDFQNGSKNKAWRQIAPEGEKEDAALNARIEALLGNASRSAKEQQKVAKPVIPMIEQRHLMRSLANTRPSVSPADRAKLHRIYSALVSDRDGSMGNGDLGRETGTRASLM